MGGGEGGEGETLNATVATTTMTASATTTRTEPTALPMGHNNAKARAIGDSCFATDDTSCAADLQDGSLVHSM